MNIYDIESFLTIVKEGSFSGASKVLCITQPTLSQRIKLLEDDLGYPLFKRQRGIKNITLTPKGEAFVDTSKQILDLWLTAKSASAETTKDLFKVAIIGSVLFYGIPTIEHAFNSLYPDIELSIQDSHSIEAYDDVKNGKVDIAIVGKLINKEGIKVTPLCAEPRFFVCSKNSIYPDVINPEDLDLNFQRIVCQYEVSAWQDIWFKSNAPKLIPNRNIVDPKGSEPVSFEISEFNEDTWALAPLFLAQLLEAYAGTTTKKLLGDPLPSRAIYAIQREDDKNPIIDKFISCLISELQKNPGITLL